MKKTLLIATAALTLGLSSPASAYVHHYYHHMHKVFIPGKVGSSAAGVAATGGFIAFVAILAGYDLLRRTSCIGDPWGLGGPGFGEPQPATGNIMVPLYMRGGCGARPKALRVRG